MKTPFTSIFVISALSFTLGCTDAISLADESSDPKDACVFCADEGKADAFGIKRNSYLAYGIVSLANQASLVVLDDDVPLDRRAANGIVDQRPFEYIEQIDTVSYVGKTAFRNMASYAQANGYVPFCGDGNVQAILEACDDGNSQNGDGCSDSCATEVGNNQVDPFFASQNSFIKGSDIGVSLVKTDGYYLRQRNLSTIHATDAIEEILERADGILANSAKNGKVSFDELALLSKEPFLSSLFNSERAALQHAWEIFEVSTETPAVVEWTHSSLNGKVPFTTKIERPGPITVDSERPISSFEDAGAREVLRRLQQMPSLNADNNVNTIEMADIEKGLGDFSPVFTADELWYLEGVKTQFFNEATPAKGGDFVIEYNVIPKTSSQLYSIATFDDWSFQAHVNLEVQYDAGDYKSLYSGNSVFDGNLRTKYRFQTQLLRKGTSASQCSVYSCVPFSYRGVRWLSFNGTSTTGARKHGYVLMEYWDANGRAYNRVVKFNTTFGDHQKNSYNNEFMGARPALADGTPLSFRKGSTVKYGNGKSYTRFNLVKVQTKFNRNIKKFFPLSHDKITSMKTGRYQEVAGITIDVHASGAVIAYVGNCEAPMSFDDGQLVTSACGPIVKIDFLNGPHLFIYRNGRRVEDVRMSTPWEPARGLDLDRTYYEIK